MKKRYRLTRQRDFQSTMEAPRLHAGRALVAFASRRPDGSRGRVGVAVSRRLSGSVVRNRARRRVREVVRILLLRPDSPLTRSGIPYDVVLIARPASLQLPFGALEAEAGAFLAKLERLGS